MEGLDELLTFPSGGAMTDNIHVIKDVDLVTATVNIHTDPIIMTAKKPQKNIIPSVTEFYGTASLTIADIIALNGVAVLKILASPKDKSKEITPSIFLLTPPQQYSAITDIEPKQILFICLFHHLFFLAKRAKYPSFPMFTDSFSDKFDSVKLKLGDKTLATDKQVFGENITDIDTFWTELKGALQFETKDTVYQMIALIRDKSAKELYDYFLNDTATIVGSDAIKDKDSNMTSDVTKKQYNTMSLPTNPDSTVNPKALELFNAQFDNSGRPKSLRDEAKANVANALKRPPLPPSPPSPPSIEEAKENEARTAFGPPPSAENAANNLRRLTRRKNNENSGNVPKPGARTTRKAANKARNTISKIIAEGQRPKDPGNSASV
jgi:hypothetical protein